MIDKTIKNIKKYFTRLWRGYLQQKYQKKKTLQGFGGDTYSKNSKYRKIFFVFPINKRDKYKMAAITKETYENSSVEVITDNLNNLWLNERHVETQLGLTNLPALTSKYIKKHNGYKEYKKQRSELNESSNQPNRRFIHADLALKIIMNCRTDESYNLKRNLGFTLHDVINTKEQSVIYSIKDVFEGQDIQNNIVF